MQNLILAAVQRIDAIDAPTAHPDLAVVLASIRQLSGATEAVLLRRTSMRQAVSVVAQSARDDDLSWLGLLHDTPLPMEGDRQWLEWFRPESSMATGLLLGLTSARDSTGKLALMLTFDRPVTAIRDAVEQVLPAISILLESHLALKERMGREQGEGNAAIAALQQAESGVVVVRADRTVLFSNAAADAILAEEDGLTMRRDILTPTNYRDAVRLHTAIDCVAEGSGAGARDRQSGIVLLLARRVAGSRPLIAVITPVTGCDAGDAAAIIYIRSPDGSGVKGLVPICAAHGLSQVETRLVTCLVNGATITEAASDMRIKPATARSYLKQIFAKTNTHRQVDLVQLLMRYLRAVRGDFDFQAG